MTEAGTKTISLRTAALLAAILVLGQLLITQWTTKAAGQQDLIDYVSFAGTITSMLLAVLAIVYSYYTATSQKTDATRVATQIASLSATISKLDSSEIRLSDELTKLGEIRAALNEVGERVQSSNELSTSIRTSVEAMREELIKKDTADLDISPGSISPGYLEYASKMAELATSRQTVSMFTAYMRIRAGKEASAMDAVKKYMMPYRINPEPSTESILFGEVFAYGMILLDLEDNLDEFANALRDRIRQIDIEDESTYNWSQLIPIMEAGLDEELAR